MTGAAHQEASRPPLYYLDQSDREDIEAIAAGVKPLMGKHPQLGSVDLVVEGGVGGGSTMPHILRYLFPNALYVGTDLSEQQYGDRPRVEGEIDGETLKKVVAANQHPTESMDEAIIRANCMDKELLEDIMRKTGTVHPLLASYRALFALVDRKSTPWERKGRTDMFMEWDLIDEHTPYTGQIHIGTGWIDGSEELSAYRPYYRLESAAQEEGWVAERFNNGLLVLNEGHPQSA